MHLLLIGQKQEYKYRPILSLGSHINKKWNSRDTMPIKPTTNQVLCPRILFSTGFDRQYI
jgi:hypothetical protein